MTRRSELVLVDFAKMCFISLDGNYRKCVVRNIVKYIDPNDKVSFSVAWMLCTIESGRDLNKERDRIQFIFSDTVNYKPLHSKEKTASENSKISSQGPLTQSQKKTLQQLIVNRRNNLDSDGCIVIPHVGSGGKGLRFMEVPTTQVPSDKASTKTQNKRSKLVEKLYKVIAAIKGSGKEEIEKTVHSQRVNDIRRNIDEYTVAAKEAGIKVMCVFKRETVLGLKSVMTLTMWRMLKRVFKAEIGQDLFGSETRLRDELQTMEYTYECGTVTSLTGDIIEFVRVKDVKEVVQHTVSELYKCKQLMNLDNVPPETLWLHISGDKGGKSTKLILQVINSKERHSIKFAKLLGFFEGKDSQDNIQKVFGGLLKDLQETANNIGVMNLKRPPTCNQQAASSTKCQEQYSE